MCIVGMLLLVWVPRAEAKVTKSHGGEGSGRITDGRPTAVVVVDGAGQVIGSWSASSGGGGRAPDEWTCRYHEFGAGNDPGQAFVVAIDYESAPTLEEGQAYAHVCRDGAGVIVYEMAITWDPADPFSGLVVEERLAEAALADLGLSAPEVAMSPPASSPHLVGLATWLWVEEWAPVTATATLAGTAATVTATPVALRWDMGDGTTVECDGPGRPYRPDGDADSGCVHIWEDRSTVTSAGTYSVTATMEWHVTWTASTGATGDLGTLTSTTTEQVTVLEAQAVIGP